MLPYAAHALSQYPGHSTKCAYWQQFLRGEVKLSAFTHVVVLHGVIAGACQYIMWQYSAMQL